MNLELQQYRLRYTDQSKVYEWVEANQPKNRYTEDRKEFEAELLKRNEPLINFGLALFSVEVDTNLKLMEIGDTAVKKAVLSAYDFTWSFGDYKWEGIISELIENFEEDLLEAYFSNPHLEDRVLESSYERKDPFDKLVDQQWYKLLCVTVYNKRLSQEYDSRKTGGMAEYMHNQAFNAAWKLFEKLPVNKDNAILLS